MSECVYRVGGIAWVCTFVIGDEEYSPPGVRDPNKWAWVIQYDTQMIT